MWTLEAGRSFYRDGEPAFVLVRNELLAPTEADALCRRIVALLNNAVHRELEQRLADDTDR